MQLQLMNTSANEVDTNVKVQNVSPPSANGNVKRAAVAKSVAEFMSRVTEAAQKGFAVGTLVKPKKRRMPGIQHFRSAASLRIPLKSSQSPLAWTSRSGRW